MAGGKETPRQKMIGMMYLVLTALLALNVSKSILNAFINIEKNIQISNESEWQRGNNAIAVVQEKTLEIDSASGKASPKAMSIYNTMMDIDKEAAKAIQEIDKVKLLIFQAIQEDLDPKAEKPICILDKGTTLNFNDTKKPGLSNWPNKAKGKSWTKPIPMNLHNVSKKDAYDEQMLIMGINESIEAPNKSAPGFAIWPTMLEYRSKLCENLVKSYNELQKLEHVGDTVHSAKSVVWKDPKINKFKDIKDLESQLDKKLKALQDVDADLFSSVKNLYMALTKNEKIPDPNEETGPLHWIGMTFDHAPAVAAIAALSGLQSEVLKSRADAMEYLQSKVGGGQYSFNKVDGFSFAPGSALPNSKIVMQVMMAAFDTERQPEVKPNQGRVIDVREGIAYVEVPVSGGGDMKLSGTVSIKDKTGKSKSAKYESTVQIVEKSGSVSAPELQILYTGYDNIIVPSAAGSVKTPTISCPGATATRTTYKGQSAYKVRVSRPGQTINITVRGEASDGTASTYGPYTYYTRPFPSAEIQTETISKSAGGRVLVGLGPSSPFPQIGFTVVGGTITYGATRKTFNGNVIPSSALSAAPRNSVIGVTVRYKRNGTSAVKITKGALTVTR